MILEKAKRETVPAKPRNTDTITFSLPPEMALHLRQMAKEEDRTVSELLRKPSASTWRSRSGAGRGRLERLRSRRNDQE